MVDDINLVHAMSGSPEFADVVAMSELMRDAIASGPFDWSTPETTAKAITAAASFAGIMFGQMIAMGAAKDQDMRRAGEMALTNFRMGAKIGKRRAARISSDQSSGGMAQ